MGSAHLGVAVHDAGTPLRCRPRFASWPPCDSRWISFDKLQSKFLKWGYLADIISFSGAPVQVGHMSETQALSPNHGRTLLFRPGLLRRPLVEGNLDGGNGENSQVPPSLAGVQETGPV